MLVEVASKAWFRFILTGNVIGGRLKTPGQADSESLQAKWIKNISEVFFNFFFLDEEWNGQIHYNYH